jgi:hypothetical protein
VEVRRPRACRNDLHIDFLCPPGPRARSPGSNVSTTDGYRTDPRVSWTDLFRPMTFSPRSVPLVLLATLVLDGIGCREASQPALEPQFDWVYPFVGDRALIQGKTQFGSLRPDGPLVWPPERRAQ